MNVSRWGWNILISLDQLLNTLFGGDPDETVSSRAAKARDSGRWWGIALCRILDTVDPGHSERALEKDEGSRSAFRED